MFFDIRMFLECENNSGILQIISRKFQNSWKFQISHVIKVKTLKEDLSNGDNSKSKMYHKKWQKISDIFV